MRHRLGRVCNFAVTGALWAAPPAACLLPTDGLRCQNYRVKRTFWCGRKLSIRSDSSGIVQGKSKGNANVWVVIHGTTGAGTRDWHWYYYSVAIRGLLHGRVRSKYNSLKWRVTQTVLIAKPVLTTSPPLSRLTMSVCWHWSSSSFYCRFDVVITSWCLPVWAD